MHFARISGHLLVLLSVISLALAAMLGPLDVSRPTASDAATTTAPPGAAATAHRR
jgi:hypothetical protein